jgi:hypothetical protein
MKAIEMTTAIKYVRDIIKKSGTVLAQREQGLAGVVVVGVLLLFISSWWNRYLSPASGGELLGAQGFDIGLPYRDYYGSAPPGMSLLSLVITWFSGPKLIALWGAGVLLRLSGAICIYVWLCRLVSPLSSAIAVISTFIFASVDVADTPYFYNHIAVTFAIYGAFALSFALDSTLKRRLLFSLLGGVFLGIALLIKQTTGIIAGSCLVGAIFFLLASRRLFREMGETIAALITGAAVPIVGCLAWIYSLGALSAFFDQVFGRGPSSKGGALASFLRPFSHTRHSVYLSLIAVVCLLLIAWGALLYRYGKRKGFATPMGQSGWLAVGALIGAILLGRNAYLFSWNLRFVFLSFAYLSMIGCLFIWLWLIASALLDRQKDINTNAGLLAALGFGCAYSLSISWPVFEVMIFPGCAFLLALFLERPGPKRKWFRAEIVAVLVCLVMIAVARKHTSPFDWGLWSEPPLVDSMVKSNIPELKGFVLSPQTEGFYEKTVQTILAHSTVQDRIFVYPNLPILYALTHRRPATFGLVHWVDTCPDFLAEADAHRLLRNPPKVMVIHATSLGFLRGEELTFRNGRPSGVRKIVEAIQILTPRYRLVQTSPVPGDKVPIQIWVLKA